MALVLRELYKSVIYLMTEARDTRMDDYFLMGPFQFSLILLIYVFFVKTLGPQIMEHRKPFELKKTMIVYNALQVVLCLWLGCYGSYTFIKNQPDWRCIPTDFSLTENGMREAQITYYYYLLKIFDLLDTVFFILRKKNNQVTFLHFYHHIIILTATFVVIHYFPGGHVAVLDLINSFVHSIMYFYYLLTCIKSELKASIWWKKHITHLQMLQFIILIIHFGHPLVFGNCSLPKFWLFLGFSQNLFMMILFSDFYYRTYINKSKRKVRNSS